MNRRIWTTFATTLAACLLAALGVAAPAGAVTAEQRLSVLSSWTQTSASSYQAWNSARQNQSGWAEYAFDWSTDLCSASPDNPLGFDFRLSCHRHDFGYRNYKQVGQFPANKARLDDAFYADLSRKCATYASYVRPACYSLAWVYYQAVRQFGDVIITADQLAHAAELKAAGEARMAGWR
jgi:hypothetical protein